MINYYAAMHSVLDDALASLHAGRYDLAKEAMTVYEELRAEGTKELGYDTECGLLPLKAYNIETQLEQIAE